MTACDPPSSDQNRRSSGLSKRYRSNPRPSGARCLHNSQHRKPIQLITYRKAKEKVQGAKNEKCSEAEPRHPLPGATQKTPRDHSLRSPKAWTAAGPSMGHQLCRIHPQ
ncbi:unnamed protein product [Caenorhabditis nigoni]